MLHNLMYYYFFVFICSRHNSLTVKSLNPLVMSGEGGGVEINFACSLPNPMLTHIVSQQMIDWPACDYVFLCLFTAHCTI